MPKCYNVFMEENRIEPENKVEVVRRSSAYPEPPKPINWFVWLSMPVVFMLGLGSGWLLWGGQSQPAADDGLARRYDVSVDDDPFVGPVDAPVTIVEFSDYQCPYCIRWHESVYSRLLADYEGKIRFVYRDLPLTSIHPEAQGAAEAANCAGEQNAYWQYHDALFGAAYGLSPQAYSLYAADLGLDMPAFDACVAERRYQNEVAADAEAARSLGANSTPTFYINGLLVVGSQPYEVFKQIIDQELASAAPTD
jgi:protein-disulfide isomerase